MYVIFVQLVLAIVDVHLSHFCSKQCFPPFCVIYFVCNSATNSGVATLISPAVSAHINLLNIIDVFCFVQAVYGYMAATNLCLHSTRSLFLHNINSIGEYKHRERVTCVELMGIDKSATLTISPTD